MPDHLRIPLAGAHVEVPRAALAAELERTGPIGSLALVEAIIRFAPRDKAIARLDAAIVDAPLNTLTLTALLGLCRLDAKEATPTLERAADELDPPLDASARCVLRLVNGDFATLAAEIARDEIVAQRAALFVAMLPAWRDELAPVFVALSAALDRLQPLLGVTAYRAMLGDVAEAAFRAIQHGAQAEQVLGSGRGALVDRLAAELPGTPDLVAARAMAWLLGTLAPADDAARSAIERARARFRDPGFHRDCAVILGEDPALRWPPR